MLFHKFFRGKTEFIKSALGTMALYFVDKYFYYIFLNYDVVEINSVFKMNTNKLLTLMKVLENLLAIITPDFFILKAI